jgi:hypothetical protein
MIMTSGIMNTTQDENITSPQNKLKSPSTNMHRVQQRRSKVPIYTNCEGGDIYLGRDDDGDGDACKIHACTLYFLDAYSNILRCFENL